MRPLQKVSSFGHFGRLVERPPKRRSLLFRHVHAQCDPEAAEQAMSNLAYRYMCRVCKSGGPSRAAAITANSSSSPSRFNDDSNDNWSVDDVSPSSSGGAAAGALVPGSAAAAAAAAAAGDYDNLRMGLGKGKPMSVLGGKRGRRGYGMAGRPRSGSAYSPLGAGTSGAWKGGGPSKPGVVGSKKGRVGDLRRRGRQPKIRGMVGLQVGE